MRDEYDIGIVGGGMVGASLALALEASRASVVLVEPVVPQSAVQPSFDQRGLALSLASSRILARLGVWNELRSFSNPIRRVHVSRQGRFGRVLLDARKLGLPALGHVVPAQCLGNALLRSLHAAAHVDLLCPGRVQDVIPGRDAVGMVVGTDGETRPLRCRLLVVADGTHSEVRTLLGIGVQSRDYGQTALVAAVTPASHDDDTAYERFTPAGPLALLPLQGRRCVAVTSVANAALDEWSALDDGEFLARLDSAWGRRFGGFTQIGVRRPYPLQMVLADTQIRDRVVLLGNAAHTIHPNGAQGFNLALRDVAGLAEQVNIAVQAGGDPGERGILDHYLAARQADQGRVIRFSDGIARLYGSTLCTAGLAGSVGMLLASIVPPLQDALTRHGTGLVGRQPAWVRGAAVP